ncbi:MAG TPA: hypothetical protein VF516_39300 [Kofleriaceae bacterium]
MDDALRVGFGERAAHLDEDLEHPLPFEWCLVVEHLVQALAVEELHHDVQRAPRRLIEVVHRDRVGIAQVAHHHDLTAKPRDQLVVPGHVGVQELECDLAAGRKLYTTIHRAEHALADLRLDLVPIVGHAVEVQIPRLGTLLGGRAHRQLLRWVRLLRSQPVAAHAAESSIRLERPVTGWAAHGDFDTGTGRVRRNARANAAAVAHANFVQLSERLSPTMSLMPRIGNIGQRSRAAR